MTSWYAVVGCATALTGLLGLELHALPASGALTGAQTASTTEPVRPHDLADPDPARLSRLAEAILARPLFAPGRRPPTPSVAASRMPRLAGVVVAPPLRLALLQLDEDENARPRPVRLGGEIFGWRAIRIDAEGVLLRRDGRTVRLSPQRAGPRPIPSTPMDQIVLMREKRINPQLAW